MALYYTLPVYKASYKLVILLFQNSDNFEKVKLANVNLVNLKKPCG